MLKRSKEYWFPILGGRLLKNSSWSLQIVLMVSNPWREAIEVKGVAIGLAMLLVSNPWREAIEGIALMAF